MLGAVVTLLGGQAEPPDGYGIVLRYAQTVGVPDPEGELGGGVTLLGGEAVPPDGFRVVPRHAPTVGVRNPEVVLGAVVTLLGARRNHRTAMASSCGTPRPSAYMSPRLCWALA